jgi:hypothetical protein
MDIEATITADVSGLWENHKKKWMTLIVAVVGTMIAMPFFWTTDVGFNYMYEDKLAESVSVITGTGVQVKKPFFNKIRAYKQVATVSFHAPPKAGVTAEQIITKVTRNLVTPEVRFADTYTGHVPATFRFKLGSDPKKMQRIHQEFRFFGNLVDSLLVQTAKDLMVNTSQQFTGEELLQGGLNQYRERLEDQLRNGIYATERVQVEVETTGIDTTGLDNENSDRLIKQKRLIWKTVILRDGNNNPIRLNNPLAEYGIEVTQVTVQNPIPEDLLNTLLNDKKKLVADRIKAVQGLETKRAQAKDAQLEKEIERTRARQDQLRIKELAVIGQKQKVEVAEQEKARALVAVNQRKEVEIVNEERRKAVAVIQKLKELEIAEANLGIQTANAKAAVLSLIHI